MSSVDQIKSKMDIVSLVGQYVKLEKAGGSFKGRCPFHNEKTPSFFVSPDRGSYYCFGCHAKGDIFTFVQEFEGLDFVGALKVLAEKTGVELIGYNRGEKTEKEHLHEILEQATLFYQRKLQESKEAAGYLKARGIKTETIDDFRIGFAPSEWRELFDYLKSRNVSEADMLKCGLIKRKDESSRGTESYYDTFRGRIMFPLCDSAGRTVGFSGRILVADLKNPKYLNSPETVFFNKSEILFGFDKAKTEIRRKDYSILVEGQIDLVMMHQVGFSNTVAGSGTALTVEHLTKLRRLSPRIIMAYDGDSAGFLASNRSAQIALQLGMELKIAEMPEGKDPADLAKETPEVLKEVVKHSKHIIDFYTDVLIKRGLEPRELGKEVEKNVLPYVSMLPSSIEKSHFIKSIAKKTFIKEDALWDDLKKINTGKVEAHKVEPKPTIRRVDAIERKVLGLIMWRKSKEDGPPEVNFEEVERRARSILGERMKELEEMFEKEKDSILFETEAYYGEKNGLEKEVEELLKGLEEELLKKQFGEAMIRLQKAETGRNSAEILKYLEDCQRISQKINEVKQKI